MHGLDHLDANYRRARPQAWLRQELTASVALYTKWLRTRRCTPCRTRWTLDLTFATEPGRTYFAVITSVLDFALHYRDARVILRAGSCGG